MQLLKRLFRRFQDREYRRSYAESFVDSYLATQIKVLREQRNLTQKQLGDLADVKQSQICRWENINNSGWQIRSLKNLAKAMDLVLVVRFASFSEILPDIDAFGREALQRPSFDDDPLFSTPPVFAEVQVATDADAEPSDPSVDSPAARVHAQARGQVAVGGKASNVFDFGAYKRAA